MSSTDDGPSAHHAEPASVPLGQRLYDNVFLLLAVGVVIMLVVYTGWGLWELVAMPAGTLP
jgi:hypothetical protein